MRKVGIITMYYGSKNYGGVLQSYALQKAISQLGYESEQISFAKKSDKNIIIQLKNRLEVGSATEVIKWSISRGYQGLTSKFSKIIFNRRYGDLLQKRNEKFSLYCDSIPHSEVFYSGDIDKSLDYYDIFVCGSDQIWKPGVACREYLLKFVPDDKIKFSYAASVSKNVLSNYDKEYLIEGVNRLDSISVRESQAVELLGKYIDRNVEWVLDPTMLLTPTEWEQQCVPIDIKEKYIFCYLLGADTKQRRIIKKLAKNRGMKIVTIPYSNGQYNFVDNKFGDIQVCDAGPIEFISLIRNASLIITDSFHATVFSNIFERDFYVLERTEEVSMNSRIISLLNILNLSDRFLSGKEGYKDIMNCTSIEFNNRENYEKMLIKSRQFLINNLKSR